MGQIKDVRKDLIKTGKHLVKDKFVIANGGNISVRTGHFIYIKAKGACLDSPKKRDYVRIDLRTNKPTAGIPSSEQYIHIACYKKRPDIKAVLHLHPVFSTAVANSRIKLGPISYELLSSLGSPLVRARYKPAGSAKLAREIPSVVRKANGILLPNHGLLALGEDLDVALERAVAIERACKVLVFSRLLGLYRFLPRREAKRIISFYR